MIMRRNIDIEWQGKQYSLDIQILGVSEHGIEDWYIKRMVDDNGNEITHDEWIMMGEDIEFNEEIESQLADSISGVDESEGIE